MHGAEKPSVFYTSFGVFDSSLTHSGYRNFDALPINGNVTSFGGFNLDAKRSSAVFGASDLVQPSSTRVLALIRT